MRAYMPPGPREGMLLGEPALFPFRHPLGWTPRVRVVDGDRLVGVVASVGGIGYRNLVRPNIFSLNCREF